MKKNKHVFFSPETFCRAFAVPGTLLLFSFDLSMHGFWLKITDAASILLAVYFVYNRNKALQ